MRPGRWISLIREPRPDDSIPKPHYRGTVATGDRVIADRRILDGFAADNDIRVVVLTGAGGKAFVSGADISRFADERATVEAQRAYNLKSDAAYSSIAEFPKPTIATLFSWSNRSTSEVEFQCDLHDAWIAGAGQSAKQRIGKRSDRVQEIRAV